MVDERRAYVEKISDGKLVCAYCRYGRRFTAKLYLDLDAQNQAKQGVVVDIRNKMADM